MLKWARGSMAVAALLLLTGAASEQDKADCLRGTPDAKLRGCTAVIDDPKVSRNDRALSYSNRGIAQLQKRNADAAISDLTEAVRLNPQLAVAYAARGSARLAKGEVDRALGDFEEASKRGHQSPQFFVDRGRAHAKKGDLDQAIGDYNRAIEKNAKSASAYANRGGAYARKNDLDRAIADYEEAIKLGLRDHLLHFYLGQAYLKKGVEARAIVQFEEAIRIKPNFAGAYNGRGEVYERQSRKTEALDDYRYAVELPAEPGDVEHQRGQAMARANRERLSGSAGLPASPAAPGPIVTAPAIGRRVALVVGNSAYSHAGALANPVNDAKAISAALKRVGFQEVRERLNLSLMEFNKELKTFSDLVERSDWAVIYFAGHGLEIGGRNYLIPVDAELASDRHLEEEAINMSRLLDKLEPAKELKLVILDACRNNPFIDRMSRGRQLQRSVSVGLAELKDTGGVMVAYAARAGTIALDGTGSNSPFAEALVAHLEEPGLEVSFLFRKVRDKVIQATANKQVPWTYGSLPAKSLMFKAR